MLKKALQFLLPPQNIFRTSFTNGAALQSLGTLEFYAGRLCLPLSSSYDFKRKSETSGIAAAKFGNFAERYVALQSLRTLEFYAGRLCLPLIGRSYDFKRKSETSGIAAAKFPNFAERYELKSITL